MAAPSTVYKDHKARVPLGDAQGGVASFRDLFVAKFLQNTTPDAGDGYFNAADIPPTAADHTAAINKIKQIFKLDLLIGIQTSTGAGFIGAVLEGSTNSLYHKSTRFSGVPVTKGVAGGTVQHILLNDAGLNTKGDVYVNTSIDNVLPSTENNGFKITAKFTSAFFVSTIKHGIRWRQQGIGEYIEAPSFGTLGQRVVSDKNQAIVDVDPSDTLQIIAGNTYEVIAYISNDEGEIYLQMNNVVANTISMTLKYAAQRTLEAFMYATEATYYRDRRLLEGSGFFRFIDATGAAYDGYYIYNQSGGTYYYYEISNGLYLGSSTFSPRSIQQYYGYGSTYNNALQDAINNNWTLGQGSERAIWWDQSAELWYSSIDGNVVALDGFYIVSNSESEPGIYENLKIVNGSFVGSHPDV